MAGSDDLAALFEQLTQNHGLMDLLGGPAAAEAVAKMKVLQEKMPAIKAQLDANLKKAAELEAEQEAYLKRLRGEEVESDKEKERDLDSAIDRFETEHGKKPEEMNAVIQRLLQLVEPQQQPSSKANAWR